MPFGQSRSGESRSAENRLGRTDSKDGRSQSDPIDGLSRILVPLSLLTVFLAGFHSLVDADVWFHLRAGKEIAGGHIPRIDTFSYPSAGRPYLDLHWLFQVLLYRIYSLGGEAGLIWFACLVTTATYFLLYRLARRQAQPVLSASLIVLGIIVASERLSPRPEILTFLFVAVVQWLVQRHREGVPRAWLYVPLVLLIWVNVEGLFVLGYVVLVAGLLDSPKDRPLWMALGLSIAVSLVNPYFLEGALHPLVLFTRINRSLPIYSATIGEFLSPFADAPLHPSVAIYPFYLGLIALGLLACGRWPRRSELFLLAVFVYLSLSARRNLALLPLVATPILARWYARLGERDLIGAPWQRLAPGTRRGLAAAAALLALAGTLGYDLGLINERIYRRAESPRVFGTGPGPVAFARGAADYLNHNPVQGPVFSSFAAGSYFIWAVPSQKVFIDGRLEVHTPEHYARYLRILQGGQAWTEADQEFGFNVVVLQQTGGQELLLNRLLKDGGWAPVFLDDTALVLLKKTAQNEELIRRDFLSGNRLRQLFPAMDPKALEAGFSLPSPPGLLARMFLRERVPWSRIYLGQFFLSIHRLDMALAQFVEGIRAAPGVPNVRLLAAMTLNQMGRPDFALEFVESLAGMPVPGKVRAQALAARGDALNALHRPAEAAQAYSEYLEKPGSPQQVPSILANRALARLRSGDLSGAREDVTESLRRDPRDPMAYWVRGQVEEAQGRPDTALEAYLRFQELGGRSAEVETAVKRLQGN